MSLFRADAQTARAIGYRQAFKAITAGLIVAYALMAMMASDTLWLFTDEYVLNLSFAALLLYGMGYFLGGISGKLILVKRYPALLIGLFSGFVMIGVATFIGGFVGFFQEGLHGDLLGRPYAFEDYVLKPVYMVWFWGFPFIAAIGLWYGWSVKRRGLRNDAKI